MKKNIFFTLLLIFYIFWMYYFYNSEDKESLFYIVKSPFRINPYRFFPIGIIFFFLMRFPLFLVFLDNNKNDFKNISNIFIFSCVFVFFESGFSFLLSFLEIHYYFFCIIFIDILIGFFLTKSTFVKQLFIDNNFNTFHLAVVLVISSFGHFHMLIPFPEIMMNH